MARRKPRKQVYTYECSLTGQSIKTTRKVDNPEELGSVRAFYELNPEMDDRPEAITKGLGDVEETMMPSEEEESEGAEEKSEE